MSVAADLRQLETTSSEAWQLFKKLRTARRLIDDYPDIPALLAGMSADERLRAGRSLARIDVQALLAAHPATALAKIAITGSSTVATLVEPLTAELARHGIALDKYLGGYGEYVFELGNPQSLLYASQPDLTVCLLDAETVFQEIGKPWRVEHVEAALDGLFERLHGLARMHGRVSHGYLLINTIPLPRRLAHQLVDLPSRMRLSAAWRDFNARLLRLACTSQRLLVWDFDLLQGMIGRLDDPRMRIHAGLHISDDGAAQYARDIAHVMRVIRGAPKKCLVLDLDDTLWGGIVGDCGMQGLALGETGEGAAYRQFQQVAGQLASQGVLLATCSKNDEVTALAVLREHPSMVLREQDFVAHQINWQPKDHNLKALASRLDLGIDSFVFMDDSAFECGLVRANLPRVAVVHADRDPVWHGETLLDDDWFMSLGLTAEDLTRKESYLAEQQRRQLQESAVSMHDYLTSLGIEAELFVPADADLIRLAQLTQRTNQFNLTTWRLDEPELRKLLGDPAHHVFALRSRDRFGEHGVIGAVFTEQVAECLTLSNMLLSCRVFSRGIESACLCALMEWARDRGVRQLKGLYAPSSKNGRFADFYTEHGFQAIGESDGVRQFVFDLSGPSLLPPPHIALRRPENRQ